MLYIKMRGILNFEDFDTELDSHGTDLVVVDFSAKWCKPCKILEPQLVQLDNEHEKVHFYKVDVDENPDIAENYEVNAMPTVLFFREGKVIEKVVGLNFLGIQRIVENLK